MKKIFILISLLISFSVFANISPKTDTNNDSIKYSKTIIVHGMACAFCSNNLEKKLKKEEAVDQVKVDLTNKTVSVLFKKDKSIEDKKLKEIITSSGLEVVKIESSSSSG